MSRAHDCTDAGGTSPWMGEGRTMQELLSRVTQERLPRRRRSDHLRFLLLLTLFINFRGDTSDSDPCFAYFECLLNQGMPFQKVKRRVFFQSEP